MRPVLVAAVIIGLAMAFGTGDHQPSPVAAVDRSAKARDSLPSPAPASVIESRPGPDRPGL
jgi:hypothetical protein